MKPLESSDRPDGLVRFAMVRNIDEADEVICFSLFDGRAEELRASSEAAGRNEQQEAIAPFVESVGADGLYEVVEDISGESGSPLPGDHGPAQSMAPAKPISLPSVSR